MSPRLQGNSMVYEEEDDNTNSTTTRNHLLERMRDVELQLEGSIQRTKHVEDQLKLAMADIKRKDSLIQTLQRRIIDLQDREHAHARRCHCHPLDEEEIHEETKSEFVDDDENDASDGHHHRQQQHTTSSSRSVQHTIEEIQRFLFMEARHVHDAQSMLEEYSKKLLDLGIPLDRFFVGGSIFHPKALAYVWKWQKSCGFQEHRVPPDVFDRLVDSNEPFALLCQGKVSSVRIRRGIDEVPIDSQWFIHENYQDYLALPMTYKGKFLGGIAWGTKAIGGFTKDQLHIFYELLNELSTIMVYHMHDKSMQYLTSVLQEEVQDRTRELAIANKTLEEANRQITRQSEAQLRHFAMMSHEIRTPLNCIVGMSSLLLESPQLHDELIDSVRMIVESGDLLCAVVNDVLDYSRLESGNVDIEIDQFELNQTLNTVVDTIRCKGNEKHVTVNPQYSVNLPQFVETDGRRLQQILYNLMGNALKFSNHNSVIDLIVSVVKQVHHEESDADRQRYILRFSVKDYGRGIEKKDLKRIFEPFTQASADTERLYGGTGLGLAITSKLVKGLGGEIRADSEFGRWTEFIVEIPVSTRRSVVAPQPSIRRQSNSLNQEIDTAPNVPLENADSSTKPVDYESLRVLIAEDNLVNQKVLARNLKALGMVHVTIVDNGQEAVDIATEKDFDVIFMDMQMPVMDGIEACRQIVSRKRDEHELTPRIIFVTAHALTNFQDDAQAAGGSGFISKPFNRKKIDSMLRALDLTGTGTRQR